MYSAQCWKSYAQGSNIVALRRSRNKEMLGVVGSKVWPVSNFAQQLQRITTHNRVCKRTQHVTSKNVESCWPTLLRLFAWGLMFGVQNKLAPANVQKIILTLLDVRSPQNKISRKIFLDLCHAIDRINQFFICFLFVCIHPQTNQLSA